MNNLIKFFTKSSKSPMQNKKEYRPIEYAFYKCNKCDKKIIKVKELGLTEMFCSPFTDSTGNTHICHDYNDGQVKLTCEDNHISTASYVACCKCGWANNKI